MAEESTASRELYTAIGSLTTGLASLEKAIDDRSRRDDRYREQREERDEQRWAAISAVFPTIQTTQMQAKLQGDDIERIAVRMESMGPILSSTANLVDAQGKLLAVQAAELSKHKLEVAKQLQAQQNQINSLKWWRAKWTGIAVAAGVVATFIWGVFQMFGRDLVEYFTGSPPHP